MRQPAATKYFLLVYNVGEDTNLDQNEICGTVSVYVIISLRHNQFSVDICELSANMTNRSFFPHSDSWNMILFSRLSKKITLFYFCLVPESDTMSVILKRVELLYNNMEYTLASVHDILS